jgi:hypothetical protein
MSRGSGAHTTLIYHELLSREKDICYLSPAFRPPSFSPGARASDKNVAQPIFSLCIERQWGISIGQPEILFFSACTPEC